MKLPKLLLVCSCLLVSASLGRGTEHVYTLSGYTTTNNSSLSPYLGLGNTFSLSLAYDDLTPVYHAFGTVQKEYLLDSATLRLTHGADTFEIFSESPLNKVIISKGFSSGSPADGYQFFVYFGGALGFSQFQIYADILGTYSVTDPTGLLLPLDSLKTVNYANSDFQISGWLPASIASTSGRVTAAHDAVAIPEPAHFALGFAGAGLLLCLIKRSRRSTG